MFQASELILNPDGSVYHLHLQPEQIASTIITVGDPDRVEAVSKYFDRIDTKVQKREFVTHTGELNGKRLSVISTGIGTDNIDIVLNELDALVNIDLTYKTIKETPTILDFIRIGTSGSMQKEVEVDSFLVSEIAMGLDGLLHFYKKNQSSNFLRELEQAFKEYGRMNDLTLPIAPYFAKGDAALIQQIGKGMQRGITITCPGFYGPQCREIRIKSEIKNMLDTIEAFEFQDRRCTNFEMETAGIYGLAGLLGHRAISCNAILANRQTGRFSTQPQQTTERLIQLVLERLT